MNIDNSLIRMYGNHQHQQHARLVDEASQGQVSRRQQHRQYDDGDQLKLSDAAKAAKTEKTDVDFERSLQAGDFLNVQIISQMVKRITGQELQMTLPSDLQEQLGGISFQAPQQPPVTSSNAVDGQTYQQSMSYFEAQTTTFNAEGSISTKDGQNVKFSVSLSMSHLFYSQANVNTSRNDASQDEPLQVSFSGMAAELTTTEFRFSIDNSGSVDQLAADQPVNAVPAPVSGQSNNVQAGKDRDDDMLDNLHKVMKKVGNEQDSFFDAVKNIFKALRIWQHHADGSQQLLALGEQTIGAVFVGHVTKPLAAEPKANALSGVLSNGSIVVPESTKPSTTPQINITA